MPPLRWLAASSHLSLHADHFTPDCADEDWLAGVSQRDWVALTHDRRIRYKPNERDGVIRHRARLLVIVGKARLGDLAASFVSTRRRIEAFVNQTPAPFIAKVYRPSPTELRRNIGAPRRVERWYPLSVYFSLETPAARGRRTGATLWACVQVVAL